MVEVDFSTAAAFFLRERFDIGSRKMALGRGGGRRPMSINCDSVTLLSQVVVAAIVVGLVNVAVIM